MVQEPARSLLEGVLAKRKRWRPLDAEGKPIWGGARGFHKPQREHPKQPMPPRKAS